VPGSADLSGPGENDRTEGNGKRTGPVTGGQQQFASAISPPWTRKTSEVTERLRLLCRYVGGDHQGHRHLKDRQCAVAARGLSASPASSLLGSSRVPARVRVALVSAVADAIRQPGQFRVITLT